jgi:hypothetical protein
VPKVQTTPDFLQRLARLEDTVAAMQREGWERDELPFYPTSYRTMAYDDSTTFTTQWETILTPRTASLSLGLVLIGDVVGTTNSGGDWQVLLNDSTVAASGSVSATNSFHFPALTIDLTPYRAATQLKVAIQTRRTSGAATGGRFGGGGSIGCAPRYARLL